MPGFEWRCETVRAQAPSWDEVLRALCPELTADRRTHFRGFVKVSWGVSRATGGSKDLVHPGLGLVKLDMGGEEQEFTWPLGPTGTVETVWLLDSTLAGQKASYSVRRCSWAPSRVLEATF